MIRCALLHANSAAHTDARTSTALCKNHRARAGAADVRWHNEGSQLVVSSLARAGHHVAPVSCILSMNRRRESKTVMSDLDVAKEEIAYLKVWLGILVVTDISTFGWLKPTKR